MRIMHIAAEYAPIAKAGGLGEVVVGLSRELTRYGHQVEIILPKYRWISTDGATLEYPSLPCQEQGRPHDARIWSLEVEGCLLHLIEPLGPDAYFDRDAIYGFPDDAQRFIYFSLAAVEYLKRTQATIDIVHLHDWHTALVAPLLRGPFAKELSVARIVLTLHNLEYQGKCAAWDLDRIALSSSSFPPHTFEDPTDAHDFNLLKAGLLYADAIVAVSPTYAEEICTPQGGWALDPHLRMLRSKLIGILNGIDYTLWNPGKDPFYSAHYTAKDSMQTIRAAKKSLQKQLIARFGLNPEARPWISAVTRLVPQKGIALLQHALHETLAQGGTFLLLGSSPIPTIQQEFDQLKKTFQHSNQVFLYYQYDEALAHELYAASDFFLIPSLFEPCGLSQMIALRYGTIPIVRATGGLKDSIIDYEAALTPSHQRNGIVFQEATPDALAQALRRAFLLFREETTTLQWLIRHAMQLDFSWKRPAMEYMRLYQKVLNTRT